MLRLKYDDQISKNPELCDFCRNKAGKKLIPDAFGDGYKTCSDCWKEYNGNGNALSECMEDED